MAEPWEANRTNNRLPGRRTALASVLDGVGKIPPSAVDVEEAVLGALMLERDAYLIAGPLLVPETFYKDEHKEIFEAIRSLFNKRQPIDLLTVVNELRATGKLEIAGGANRISELTNNISSTANIEHHTLIVVEKYKLRQIIQACSILTRDAYDELSDVFDIIDDFVKAGSEISEIRGNRKLQKVDELVKDLSNELEEKNKNQEGSETILSGFESLDDLLGGVGPGDLAVIAARPSMGKTAFLLVLAKVATLKYHKRVAVFSLEMTAHQLAIRLIAPEVGISAIDVRRGNISDAQLEHVANMFYKVVDWDIWIDDTPGLNIFELRATLRRMVAQLGIDIVFIDYLQLMEGTESDKKGYSNREQEVSKICSGLKKLAKELKIPVVALSQLSREVEKRGGQKRPILADIRESGAVEQTADQVIFLHRPEYYGITDIDGWLLPEGYTEVIVAKNRHGATGPVKMIMDKRKGDFRELDEDLDRFLISAIETKKSTRPKKTKQKGIFSIDPDDENADLPF